MTERSPTLESIQNIVKAAESAIKMIEKTKAVEGVPSFAPPTLRMTSVPGATHDIYKAVIDAIGEDRGDGAPANGVGKNGSFGMLVSGWPVELSHAIGWIIRDVLAVLPCLNSTSWTLRDLPGDFKVSASWMLSLVEATEFLKSLLPTDDTKQDEPEAAGETNGEFDAKPARWFTQHTDITGDDLQKAASKKYIRSTKEKGGQNRYSTEDAKNRWPQKWEKREEKNGKTKR